MTPPGQVPPAFRRLPIPRGSSVRVRAKRTGSPTLVVEAPDGSDLLTFTVDQSGQLDALYDETELTHAAQRLLVEVRALLGLSTTTRDPTIRIATDPTPPRSRP